MKKKGKMTAQSGKGDNTKHSIKDSKEEEQEGILFDEYGQYREVEVNWEEVQLPRLEGRGLLAALFLGIQQPRDLTEDRLHEGNRVHWSFDAKRAMGWAETLLEEFQHKGDSLKKNSWKERRQLFNEYWNSGQHPGR